MKKTFDTTKRIYKITNASTREEESNILDNIDESIQFEIFQFFETLRVYDVDYSTEIMIMNDHEFERYCHYNKMTGINDTPIDITDDLILGKLVFNDPIMNGIVIPFLKDELNVDIVLDKINIAGVQSLNSMDHKVLKG